MEVLNIDAMIEVTDPEQAAIRRLKNFFFNGILIIVLIAWLVAGSFIKTLEMPPLLFS